MILASQPRSPASVSLLYLPEFGVKLGSQIFIKHITESGLAARNRGLQEGDLILQVSPGPCLGGETEAKEGSVPSPRNYFQSSPPTLLQVKCF